MKRRIALGCATAIFCAGTADARPFRTQTKSRLLHFEYSWPSEVGTVPALIRRFTKDMREERRSMLADARDASEAKDSALPFARYSFYRDVTAAGQSGRLLSLKVETYRFTGGAHGDTDSEPILWDRQRQREIKFVSLLAGQEPTLRMLRSPFAKGSMMNERDGTGRR